MAIIPYVLTNLTAGMGTITWTDIADGDTGQPMFLSNMADKTVQAINISDGLVSMQGSNDPRAISNDPAIAAVAEWAALSTNLGEPATFDGAGGLLLLAEAPLYIRPNGSGGLTTATIILLANAS